MVKGTRQLKGRILHFVKEIWNWREKEAQRRDRPRFKVLSDERILKVAQTIADLAGSVSIETLHLTEAIGYRRMDT